MPKLVLKASLHNPISSLSYVSSVPSTSMFVPSISYPSASYSSSELTQSYPITASKPSIRCAPISRVENSFIPQSPSSGLSYSSQSSLSSSAPVDLNVKDQHFTRLDSLFYLQMIQKLRQHAPVAADPDNSSHHEENDTNRNEGRK